MEKCTNNTCRVFLKMFICGVIFLTACSSEKKVARKVLHRLTHSTVLQGHYVGFALHNLKAKRKVLGFHDGEYFTPASNTKLFTFYGALKMIRDSIPALRYIERGDSLIFWGTGDPSFLQTRLRGTAALHFLLQSSKRLFFSNGRYTGAFYGRGWQWDDYNDDYQAEISEFPIMDNLAAFSVVNGHIVVSPKRFSDQIQLDSGLHAPEFTIRRDFDSNLFRLPGLAVPPNFKQQVPYKTDVGLTLALLADTLKKPIGLLRLSMPREAKTLFGLPTDSVLREMMLPSDNFIAEQLLLVYADRIGMELNAENAISYLENHYLSELPDKPRWIDGSGLSRYNLFTPRDMITILEMIYAEVGDQQRLFDLLPAGGNRGTLKNAYPPTDRPFIFGKTGSFSNNYNQSGYILTRKGEVYVCSFMNNNFTEATSAVRKEMAELITYIHDKL